MIGLELAGTHASWSSVRVALIGATSLSKIYADALAQRGVQPEIFDGATMTLRGLAADIADERLDSGITALSHNPRTTSSRMAQTPVAAEILQKRQNKVIQVRRRRNWFGAKLKHFWCS